MSNTPQGPGWWLASDGKWYPPASRPAAVPPPRAMSAAPPPPYRAPVQKPRSRFADSLWMLPGLLCCGIFTWASFLYVGAVAKRRSWLIASGVYALLVVAAFVLMGMAPNEADGTSDTSSWQYNVGSICLLVAWFGGFVHALIINREWLAFKAAPPGQTYQAPPPRKQAKGIEPPAPADPWQKFVFQALEWQRQVAAAVASAPPGPLHDRVRKLTERVESGVTECRQIAQGGRRLQDARAKIDTATIGNQLSALPTGEALQANPARADTVLALQAQLDTAARIDAEIESATDGLVLLNARLGQVAASVIELSARPAGPADMTDADADVESVVNDLASLREAINELDGRFTQK